MALCAHHRAMPDPFGLSKLQDALATIESKSTVQRPKGWSGPVNSPKAAFACRKLCQGISTRTRAPCSRMTSDPSGFCPYHRPKTTVAARNVLPETPFDHLLPPDLSRQAARDIVKTIVEPLSEKEESGYLYAYRFPPASANPTADEIREADSVIKVGRTTDVAHRMWLAERKCCVRPEVLAVYPPLAEQKKTPWIKRVERLMLLELKDRFPQATIVSCKCGRDHREWVRIDPSSPGKMLADMWAVVEKWSEFAASHYAAVGSENEEEIFHSAESSFAL